MPRGKKNKAKPTTNNVEDLVWNEDHPARLLLYDGIVLGDIPLDRKGMEPRAVFDMYKHMAEFKGMVYDDNFTRRLRDLKAIVRRDKTRASADLEALKIAMANHPVPEFNHRGEPQWNGSKAQAKLAELIDNGEYPEKKPEDIWKGHDGIFQPFGLDTFRWKIHQYIRTQKYLKTLKRHAANKLKAHPKEPDDDDIY